ncbi:hydrolase [Penicillium subrubescens]|uniref:hydrolase n=1 Tax=Penicillium subrubescens TaxID=1316194 RepID=UPI0025453BB1|nr:hydrolase [Penicillium subrubescens]KAJ5907056.1 hydrolase [Penicillium subrubescens]
MSAQDTTGARRKCLLENVRVFDGTSFSDCQSVFIDGETIGNNPDGADETTDGKGGFLIPGLIDAHVHLHHEGHLHALASYGITTALDMAMWPANKMNGLRGKAGLPDIRSAGLPVTASGSIHSCMLPLPEEALLSGPEQADSFVQKRIDEGSDYIKLIADVPGPGQETLNAVSAAAHDKGKMVVAHASSFTPFNMALVAKADIITHAPRDNICEASLGAALGMMVSKPSLFMAILKSKRSGQGEQTYENARDSVTAMYRAGVPILAGTDCHDEPNSFFEVKHGESLHRELELLVEAGVSVLDALRAATVLPAEHFQLNDRGVIAVGKRADLVLLREDPTKDIRATRSIERVWCGGIENQSVA